MKLACATRASGAEFLFPEVPEAATPAAPVVAAAPDGSKLIDRARGGAYARGAASTLRNPFRVQSFFCR